MPDSCYFRFSDITALLYSLGNKVKANISAISKAVSNGLIISAELFQIEQHTQADHKITACLEQQAFPRQFFFKTVANIFIMMTT